MQYFSIITFWLAVLLFCGCGDKNCRKDYTFQVPFTLTPALDTFRVGDTIRVRSEIPKLLEDKSTGELISIDGFDLLTRNVITKIDSNPRKSAIDCFEPHVIQGAFNTLQLVTTVTKEIKYENLGEIYSFDMLLILKKKGTFKFIYYSAIPLYDEVNITGRSCRETVNVHYYMNDGADNNFYLVQGSPDPEVAAITLETHKDGGEYAFVVVE